MIKRHIVLVAGAAATGKTTFAKAAAAALNLPLLCKDEIKQIAWNKARWEKEYLKFNQTNGVMAYEILFYFAEQLMKTQAPFMLESNFRKPAEDTLKALIERYQYRAVTVLFDTDISILHKRFLARDQLAERHPRLKSEGFYKDIEVFKQGIVEDRAFGIGHIINVNTDDFNTVDYDALIQKILDFTGEK